MIKVENDTDIVSAGVATDMETAEVFVPSTFCLKKAEPEVGLFRLLL